MELYDKIINEILELIEEAGGKTRLDLNEKWVNEKEQKLIFKKDMAYELGGGLLPAISGLAFSSTMNFSDEIWLCGENLDRLKKDSPYARLTVLNVDDSGWSDSQRAYSAMQRIDYTRYHVYPRGFMMRISTSEGREPVRVSREAIDSGLNFQKVGRLFIDAYHRQKEVKGVKVIFITDSNFPYEILSKKVRAMETITKSLDKIFNNLVMDCRSCNLKPVCDEVEGMRQLHNAIVLSEG